MLFATLGKGLIYAVTGEVNSGAREGVVFQFEILQGRPKNKT
jgi:hypothetical protein